MLRDLDSRWIINALYLAQPMANNSQTFGFAADHQAEISSKEIPSLAIFGVSLPREISLQRRLRMPQRRKANGKIERGGW
jgi:hypothetical protein